MIPYSVLDLSPITQGSGPREAIRNTGDLAAHAESLGYHRFWLAEHHNMPGIASAATAVLIGHVAGLTERIRVGSGGIMLPNHSPLVIAEQFGTLATIYPGRIDLGVGRAPGTDLATARALRRGADRSDHFPAELAELISYLWETEPSDPVRAIPGLGTKVPVWILGSSLFGAQLAAHFGLPYAFASHFAPAALDAALETYRQLFRPSQFLEKSRFMLAVNIFAAETDEAGRLLMSSTQQAFVNLRSGRPGPLPPPMEEIEAKIDPHLLAAANQALSVSAVGSPESVRQQLARLIEHYRPDEVIFSSMVYDHQARRRCLTIAAEAMKTLAGGQTAQEPPKPQQKA